MPRRSHSRSARSRPIITEAQRKAIHLSFILLPLELLYQWLPWPRRQIEWRQLLIVCVVGAIAIDVLRIHEQRARAWFRSFFGGLIREHEKFNLLGSTYLLLAALLSIELFTRPVAAAAMGFTVLGDGFAGLVGRAYGRTRFYGKSMEGYLAGLLACLAWAAFLSLNGHLDWRVSLVAAVVASLVELLPIPLDDNLAVTLAAGYAMKLMGGA
jgi:dolichol kinase